MNTIATDILKKIDDKRSWTKQGMLSLKQTDEFHKNVFIVYLNKMPIAVLKIYPPNSTNVNHDDIVSAQNYVHSVNFLEKLNLEFALPEIIDHNFIQNETSWICVSWFDGKPSFENRNPNVLRKLFKGIIKLHLLTKTQNTSYRESNFEFETKYMYADVKRNINGWFTKNDEKKLYNKLEIWRPYIDTINNFSYIHNDLVPGNILISDQSACILDWARSCIASPLYDYSCLLFWPYMFNYDDHLDLTEEILSYIPTEFKPDLMPFYMAKRLLFTSVYYKKDFFKPTIDLLTVKNFSDIISMMSKASIPKWHYFSR